VARVDAELVEAAAAGEILLLQGHAGADLRQQQRACLRDVFMHGEAGGIGLCQHRIVRTRLTVCIQQILAVAGQGNCGQGQGKGQKLQAHDFASWVRVGAED
jgi:hypothetical protein